MPINPTYRCNKCGKPLSSQFANCYCIGKKDHPSFTGGKNVCRNCGIAYYGTSHTCRKSR